MSIETFVCADLHFSHENIIKYENRPWLNADAMNWGLINNWNQSVSKNDKVFVLGDVGFCGKEKMTELVGKLNGHKILIMGNHDKARTTRWWREVGFEDVSWYPIIYHEHIVLMHEPPTYFNDATPYFYVYGHVHGCPDYQDYTVHSACVSIERLNYRPAKLDDVISGEAYLHK